MLVVLGTYCLLDGKRVCEARVAFAGAEPRFCRNTRTRPSIISLSANSASLTSLTFEKILLRHQR
jgi:hypothetical protein